jgi:hypothetical protein
LLTDLAGLVILLLISAKAYREREAAAGEGLAA